MKPNLHMIDGGVGKHLQFTALFDAILKKYNEPKLCLQSSYPDLFKYDNRIATSETISSFILHDFTHTVYNNYKNIFFNDPYKSNFLKGEGHIIKYWADMYDIKIDTVAPNFQINKKRENFLQDDILKLGKFILVQFTGGQGIKLENYNEDNVGRNYKEGQQVVNLLREALPNVNIIVFGHDNEQEPLLNTMAFNDLGSIPKFVDKNDFMILAKHCLSFICIDSSLQHMCSNKTFYKKGIVLWGASKPKMFGYKNNVNLLSEYPYSCVIDPKYIVDKFLKLEINEH